MTLSLSKLAVAMGIATGALLPLSSNANAQSFGFDFDATYSVNNAPTGDRKSVV